MFSQIRKTVNLVVVLIALMSLAACSSDEASSESPEARVKAAVEEKGLDIVLTEAFAGTADMTAVNYSEWRQARRAVAPDILVVDMWATWCVPCLERFPAMVEMSKKYVRKGVKFASLNLDDRDDEGAIEQAKKFLGTQNAYFDHYRLDEELLDGMQKLEIQTVPAVDIYGRDGRRAFRLTGDDPNDQFTEEDIEEKITELLEKG